MGKGIGGIGRCDSYAYVARGSQSSSDAVVRTGGASTVVWLMRWGALAADTASDDGGACAGGDVPKIRISNPAAIAIVAGARRRQSQIGGVKDVDSPATAAASGISDRS